MNGGRIAIVTDDPGWHGRRLRAAFAQRGLQSVYLSLSDCRLDLSGGPPRVLLPGFVDGLPDGVFVRGIPGGRLEQVILRLDVLHGLRELGVVVYNDARAIERTVDKAMTSFLLRRAGLPTPATWACESEQQARAVFLRESGRGRKLVLKPLFGSQGLGLRLLEPGRPFPDRDDCGGVYYLQTYLERPAGDWHDFRVFVIGGRARAAMVRRGRHWITNRAQGALCEPWALSPEAARLAEEAARAVDCDYAGVDLLSDAGGRLQIIEVNGIPAWFGLQRVCSVDIAGALADHCLARFAAGGDLKAVP